MGRSCFASTGPHLEKPGIAAWAQPGSGRVLWHPARCRGERRVQRVGGLSGQLVALPLPITRELLGETHELWVMCRV